jgi:hypothetical protein
MFGKVNEEEWMREHAAQLREKQIFMTFGENNKRPIKNFHLKIGN